MTVVEHKYNPKTKQYEVSAVLSDILGLYGKPTVNATGYPLYDGGELRLKELEKEKHRRKFHLRPLEKISA
jgi:hypothetical protein